MMERTPMFRIIPTPRNEITEDPVIQNEVEKKWFKGKKEQKTWEAEGEKRKNERRKKK